MDTRSKTAAERKRGESGVQMGRKRGVDEEDGTKVKGRKRIKKIVACIKTGSRNLNEFPTELLVQIFKKLDANAFLNVRQVCRRWRSITDFMVSCKDPSPLEKHSTVLRSSYDFNWYAKKVKKSYSLGSPFPSGRILLLGYRMKNQDGTYQDISLYSGMWKPIHENFFSSCGNFIQRMVLEGVPLNRYLLLSILSFTKSLKILEVLKCLWMDIEDVDLEEFEEPYQCNKPVIDDHRLVQAAATYKSLRKIRVEMVVESDVFYFGNSGDEYNKPGKGRLSDKYEQEHKSLVCGDGKRVLSFRNFFKEMGEISGKYFVISCCSIFSI